MRPYQKEYIENIKEIAALTGRKTPDGLSPEEYAERLLRDEEAIRKKAARNMELLREGLLPALDHLFEADSEELGELEEFAAQLAGGQETADEGVFRLIHRALLSLAGKRRDRSRLIQKQYCMDIE